LFDSKTFELSGREWNIWRWDPFIVRPLWRKSIAAEWTACFDNTAKTSSHCGGLLAGVAWRIRETR
jgi:hypothetical protein